MNRRTFTYSDRLAIETMLNENKSIKEIELDIKRTSSGIIIKKLINILFINSPVFMVDNILV